MTRSAEALTAAGKHPPDIEALRLLALEAAGAARGRRRRLLAAAAPVIGGLFKRFLTHDIQAPQWPDRDRLVISPSMQPLACALLHLLGHDADAKADNAAPRGAVGCDLTPRGLDLPLNLPGHGLAAAVGLALATRLLRERFGEEIFHHATCVLVDDRDLEPGLAQETIAIAPWLRPHRLCVLHMTAVRPDGSPDGRQRCPNHLARFAAAGWHVQQARADDLDSIAAALEQAADQGVAGWEERRPAYIAVEFDAAAEVPSTTFLRQELGWEEMPAGEIPGAVRDEWRLVGLRGRKARRAWEQRVAELEEVQRLALQRRLEMPLPEEFRQHMRMLRSAVAEEAQAHDLQAMVPELLQRSARLVPEMVMVSALHGELAGEEKLPGRQEDDGSVALQVLDVGLRPMAVAALLAGMAAHGGVRPVGVVQRHQVATMLPMLDEMARAGLAGALLVLEDDRCHRAPMEVQAGQVMCLCPADAVELLECWQSCVQQPKGVALLFVPFGSMPAVRTSAEKANLSALGGYELFSAEGEVQATLYAAGWTLAAALDAAHRLEEEGVAVRVVSVPVPQRLLAQEEERRQRILDAACKVRLLVPPGEVGHAWSVLGCESGIVPTCGEGGMVPEQKTLVDAICRMVRQRLGRADEERAHAAGAGGTQPQEEG